MNRLTIFFVFIFSFGITLNSSSQCSIEFESANVSCFGLSDGSLSAHLSDNHFIENAGRTTRSFAASSGNYFDYRNGHRFSVIGDTVRIDSVTVYPNGTGNIQINIRNSADVVIYSSPSTSVIGATNQATKVYVGVKLSPGVNYVMDAEGTTVGNMWADVATFPTYPINSGSGAISITSAWAGASNTPIVNNFYFYYDWDITVFPTETFTWSNSGTTKQITGLSTGIYSVTIADSYGCSSEIGSAIIYEPTEVEVSPSVENFIGCYGQDVGIISANPSGGEINYPNTGLTSIAGASDFGGTGFGINFDILSDSLTINSVTAYPTGTGTIQLNIKDNSNAVLFTKTVNVVSWGGGAFPITVGYTLPSGTDYLIDGVGSTIGTTKRTFPANFPYETPGGNLILTNSGNNNDAYYLFYNWNVTEKQAYNISWSNSATTDTIKNLSPGAYSVSVSSSNGCNSDEEIILETPFYNELSTEGSIVYDQVFENGRTYCAEENPYEAWDPFLSLLDTNTLNFSAVHASGSLGNPVLSCLDAAQVKSIAAALNNKIDTVINCNGLQWSIGVGCATACGPVDAVAISVDAANNTNTCSCFPDFILRPKIGNSSWGGYNVVGDNCNPVSQRLRLEFNTVNSNINDISCFGANDGIIIPNVAGGDDFQPYTFTWSNSSNNDSLLNLSAGTYTVTVTDASGCTDTETYTINEPSLLNVSFQNTSASSAIANDGEITPIVSGGIYPYTYNWSNAVTDSVNSTLTPGIYAVTITDANNCILVDSTKLNFVENGLLSGLSNLSGSANCLSFDGIDDYVRVPYNSNLNSSSFTIETWLRRDVFSQERAPIASRNTTTTTGFSITVISDTYRFWLGNGISWNQVIGPVADSGVWTHLACTYDGTTARMYVNGTLEGSLVTSFVPNTTDDLFIGSSSLSNFPGWLWNGGIDEVRIWNDALSANEVKEWMSKKVNNSHPSFLNLQAYYKFDQSFGTALIDATSNYDGTLTSMDPSTDWQLSGASIGDDSKCSYPAANLVDTLANGNIIRVENFTGSPNGVQLYQVIDTAQFSSFPSIAAFVDTTEYFGVKIYEGNTYDVKIDYTNNLSLNGSPFENLIRVFKRDNGEDGSWTSATGFFSVDTDNNIICINNQSGTEFVVGFAAVSYPEEPGSGYALQFDGSNDISIPNSTEITNIVDYTYSAWIKIDDNSLNPFFSKYASGNVDFEFYHTSSGLRIEHNNLNGGTFGSVSAPVLPLNEWVHLAITYSSLTATVYVNGEQTFSGAIVAPLQNTYDFNMGSSGVLPPQFNGQLDEVSIWNTALSQSLIREWMHRKLNSNHPNFGNLVGYYRFDENQGSTLFDLVNGNDGSLSGGFTAASWERSGAALGDTSVFVAPASNLSLTMDNGLDISIVDIENPGDIISLYKVEDTALVSTTPPQIANLDDRSYFGVKMINGGSYNVVVDYTNNPDFASAAVEKRIRIMKRESGADSAWVQATSRIFLDINANTITIPGQTGTEYVLGFFNTTYPDRIGSGYALNLDGGNELIRFQETPEIVSLNNYTYSAWVNFDNTNINPIFSKRDAIAADIDIYHGASGVVVSHNVGNGGTYNFTVGPVVPINEWNHLAITHNTGNIAIYLNGELAHTGTIPVPLQSNFGFEIGTTRLNASQLNGQIDEVRLWNTPLDSFQIRQWMCRKLNSNHDSLNNLVAYYRFDENQGDSLYDLARGNNGELINMEAADWQLSGAALGDTSIFSYPSGPLTYIFSNNDSIQITSGEQLYIVEDTANNMTIPNGIDSLIAPPYFGIFTTDPALQNDIFVYYANRGISIDHEINLAKRTSNDDNTWEQFDLSFRQAAPNLNAFAAFDQDGRGEYMLAIGANNAVDFDGINDRLVFTASTSYNLVNEFTVSMWFKPRNLTGPTQYLLDRHDSYGVVFELTNDNIEFVSSNFTGDDPNVNSQIPITDTDWHFIAYTYDGTTLKGYLDDSLYVNEPKVFTLTTSPFALNIANGFLSGDYFNGALDEVRIWSRALCEPELIQNSICESTDTTGLKFYVNLNQGIAEGNNAGETTVPNLALVGVNGSLLNLTLNGTFSNYIAGPTQIQDTCVAFSITPLITSVNQNFAVNCFGDSTTLTVNATGGSGVYTYLWSNGDITATTSNLGPGNYNVTVSDGFCSIPDTLFYTISVTPQLLDASDTLNQTSLIQNFEGLTAGDQLGDNVSINQNGDIIAISSTYANTQTGFVDVYQWDGSSWNQLGVSIAGEDPSERAGEGLDLNDAGNRIAVGSPLNDDNGANAGQVRVFEWDGSSWNQMGSDIEGESAGDLSGQDIRMNTTGDRIIIGADANAGGGSNSGHARVYEWNGTDWVQLGNDIDGQFANDRSGGSVSINGTGDIIAIGARFNDGNGVSSGNTRVFEWDGSNWVQLGTDINGEAANDLSGISISLDKEGNSIAIGATNNSSGGVVRGHVRVYDWNTISWVQRGSDIDGVALNDVFGNRVSLSSTGNKVLIAAQQNDGNGSNSGNVTLYDWDGSNWNQISSILGVAAEDRLGWSIDINGFGDKFIIGSRFNDNNGAEAGLAQFYQLTVESCESYFWAQSGQTYNSTGTYYDTLVAVGGCDSIVSLNVIINNIVRDTILDSSCVSYFWQATSQTYTSSGFYNDTLNASNGCDSIVTLNLLIYPAPTATIDQGDTVTICAGETITLSASGSAVNYQWYNADSSTWNYWKGQGFSATGTNGHELKFSGNVAHIVFNDPVNNGVTVQYDNGTYWDTLGVVGFNAGATDYPSLDFIGTTPVVAYKNVSAAGSASVAEFDGSNWNSIGPATVTANAAEELDLIVINNEPYIAYRDGLSFGLNVLKYNGSSWVNVGAADFSPGAASELCIASYNNVPYVAFRDAANSSAATVMSFDGSSWNIVGTAGFTAGGVRYLDLDFDQSGNPHIVYQDGANSDQVSVSFYNGATWQNLGPAGINGNGVDFTNIEIDGNTPFISYYDQFLSNTVVRKFNGSSWEVLGIEGFSGTASDQTLAINFGIPFVGFRDNTSAGRTSVMAYINPVISNADTLDTDSAGNYAVLGISANECLVWDTVTVVESNTFLANIVVDSNASCGTGGNRISLPISWDDTASVDYSVIDFDGNASSVVVDPVGPGNLVLETSKGVGATVIAGTVLGNDSLNREIPFSPGNTIIKALVYAPAIGIPVRLKIENEITPSIFVEVEVLTTVAMAWDTLYFDFSTPVMGSDSLSFDHAYNKLVIFYDFGSIGVGDTYYLDDVIFDGPQPPIGNDGGLTASPSGGFPPYTYNWSNGETTSSITGLTAGIYTVTITDNSSCVIIDQDTITEPPLLQAYAVVDGNVTCFGASDGQATVTTLGGSGGVTFLWSDISATTSSTITGLSGGVYKVTATDASGCTATSSVLITEPFLPRDTIQDTSCVSYTWASNSQTYFSSGTYYDTLLTGGGCDSISTLELVIHPAPIVSIDQGDTTYFCASDSVVLKASGNGSFYEWFNLNASGSWNLVGNSSFTPVGLAFFPSIAVDNDEVYVAFRDGGGPSVMKFDGSTWNYVGNSTFNPSGNSLTLEFYNGEPYVSFADFNSNGAANLMKFDGTNWVFVGSPNFSGTSITQYHSLAFYNGEPYLAFSDNNQSDRATVMKYNGTSWVLVGTAGFTAGQAIDLSLKFYAGRPYLAYRDFGNSERASVMYFDGSSWVQLGSAGFTSARAAFTSLEFLNGDPYVVYVDDFLSSRVSAMTFNGTSWVQVGAAGFTSPLSSYTTTSIYNGELYVAYRDGGQGNRASSMKFNGTSWVQVGSAGFSAEWMYDAEMAVTSQGPVVVYRNDSDNRLSVSQFSIPAISLQDSIVVDTAGVYYVVSTSNEGCIATDTITVLEADTLVASIIAADSVSCNGFSDGTATVGAIGGQGAYTYSWSNSATTASISGLAPGTYTVTVSDNAGCSDTTSVLITQPAALTVTTLTPIGETCIGAGDGAAGVGVLGGTIPYTYQWSNTQTTSTISSLNSGTYTITVTDNNGCFEIDSVIVLVNDTIVPTAIAQNITVSLDSMGQYILDSIAIDNGSSDNCAIDSFAVIGQTVYGCADIVGPTPVQLAVFDTNGNSDTSSIVNITVTDTIRPIAQALDSITIYLDVNGDANIGPVDVDNGSNDNCAINTWSLDSTNFDCSEIGFNTANFFVVDPSGNRDTAVVIVEVLDTIAPILNTNNITVYLDANGRDTVGLGTIRAGSLIEACTHVYSSYEFIYGCSDIGVIFDTLIATDLSGNSDTSVFSVNVLDTIAPTVITQNITVQLDSNGSATITADSINNGTTDNCGVQTLSIDISSFDCLDIGNVNVTLTATDFSSNSSSNIATVAIEDNLSPIARSRDTIIIFLSNSGTASILPADLDNGSTDNCSIAFSTVDSSNFDCSELGPNLVTYIVEDGSGNRDSSTSIVVVSDTIHPVFNAYADITVSNDVGNCNAVVTYPLPTFTDNCTAGTITQIAGLASGQSFPLDTTLNTFVVADTAGNTDTVSFLVIVEDREDPVFNAYADITVSNDVGNCNAVVTYPLPTFTDNCTAGTITQIAGLASGQSFPLDTTLNTFVVADTAGNTDTVSFLVIVEDRELPQIVVRQDIKVYLDLNGNKTIGVSEIDSLTADNCGLDTISINKNVFSCNDILNNPVPVTLIARDVNNNIDSVIALVTVIDTVQPTVSNAGRDTILCSTQYSLRANTPGIGTGQWTVLRGNATIADPSNPNSLVTNLNAADTNIFEWTISTQACNVSSDIVRIFRYELPSTASAGPDQLICDNTAATLNAVSPAIGRGRWSLANGAGTINDTVNNRSSTSGLGIGRNTLVWTVTNGVCPPSRDTMILSVSNTPIIDAGEDITIFRVDGAQLNVISTPTEGVSYQWSPSFDIVTSSAIANPFARPEKTTEFIVTVTDSLGCFISDTVIVNVEGSLVIPTAFTPNNDGFNDTWEIKNLDGYASHKVTLFNGFGVQLFSTSNYQDWDGRYNGEDLPVGSYYFVIELETFNGDKTVETGTITIVK